MLSAIVRVIALLCVMLMSVMASAESVREALMEEVIVTATKKANVVEGVQDVAIAISAFNGEQLEALKFKDLQDIGMMVPNANLQPITRKGTQFFSIRGLSPSTSILSVDPTVGVFVNGVYIPTGAGVVFDTFDLASIEILRGPQGVLQGRNVVGGAVLMNTKKPTEEFEANVSIRGDSRLEGTGEDMTYSGFVSGPLTEGLNGKFAAYYNDDSGWFENEFNGNNMGLSETLILRGGLSWDATDNVNFLLELEYFDQDSDGAVYQATDRSSRNPEGNVWKDGSLPLFDRESHDVTSEMDGSGPFGLQSFADLRVDSVSLTTTIDVAFGDGTITNIAGWREQEQGSLGDIDGTAFTTFPAANNNEVKLWSNELRYFGSFGDFDLTTGVYYLDVEITDESSQALLLVSPSFAPGPPFNQFYLNRSVGGLQDSETLGVFTNVDYRISDAVTLSAGLRWTEEDKATKSYAYAANQGVSSVADGPTIARCGYVVGDGSCLFDFEDDDSWSNVSYKVGASWRRTEDMLLYGHVSTSYRAGNYNLRRTNVADERQALDEERMDQVEVGIKWDVNENLRFNMAVFRLEATDLQRYEFDPDTLGQVGANSADALYEGVEIDSRVFLTDSLTFTLAFGYNNAQYTKANVDINLDRTVNGEDENTPLPNAPELTYNVGILHDIVVRGYNVSSQLIYAHRDNVTNTQNTQDRGEVNTFDANITLIPGSDAWEVSLYGRNLTDEVIRTQSTRLGSLGNSAHLSTLAKGRRIGLEFKYRFN
ncbi:MAG: TonB-dependent receptor [Pseudomonadales bacterium]|nr:TonB-dependent receptor [Pseudomonadales bacterium]